jgi:putative acetyltransferase
MDIRIEKYRDEDREELIGLWERSVRATHHFLQAGDLEYIKSLVLEIDFHAFEVYCAFTAPHQLAGFLGVAGQKLEMLFLDPAFIGKGMGKTLMQFALKELKVNAVDVNEGNENAVQFYKKAGFQVYERTPLDSSGKPYPILKMKR